ncbi:MAG: hypothetical protein IAF94_07585 [Pirellulaceae bacterium]|nr:hypothetical protein [Pirellulaceae bacterium]
MKRLTRKTWCRGTFLAFCALPTLLVAIWIVRNAVLGDGTARKEDWERELSSRLGMTLTIGEVTYPQLGLAVLRQVELSDAETGEPIARAAAIEMTQMADGYVVEVVAPEIEAARLGRLAQILHERLLCQGSCGIARCEISAGELTLKDTTASRTLVDLQAALEPAEAGPRLTASFHWPDAVDSEHTFQWTLARNLDLSPPATSISVNTGQARLPCQLAGLIWPPLERLGPEAEFSGEVSWLHSKQGSAELRGTFSGVDLDALVSEQFPQILSGTATVRIDQARIDDGRLVSAAGTVEVRASGRVSRSLLVAAAEHLQLQNEAGSSGSEVLSYRRLACGFRLDGPHLQLSGSADAGSPGVLMVKATGAVLRVSPNHSASAANLARVLLPDSRLQVPLASQTSTLVQLLPVPAAIPAAKNLQTARGSHIPTRLSPGGSSTSVIRER